MESAQSDRLVTCNSSPTRFWPEILGLTIVLALSVLLQLLFVTGITIYDSTGYAHYCIEIAEGRYVLQEPNIYTQRALLVYPVALCFRLFGVSELSAAAYPMLCSLGILALTYLIGRRFYGHPVGLLSVLVLALCPVYLLNAGELLPDIPVAFFMTLSVYFFLIGHMSSSKRRWVLFTVAGVAWGAAYLAKETAVLLFLVYMVILLVERRRVSKAHWLVFLVAAAVFLTETMVYASLTGDWLWRLHSAIPNPTGKVTRLGDTDRFQIWWYWWQMFVKINGFGVLFYLLVSALGYGLVRKRRELLLPAIWFFAIYLYLQFGPWNLRWARAPANARYLIPALVPACLVVAFWLVHAVREYRRWLYYALMAVVVASSLMFTCITYGRAVELRNGSKWAWEWLEQHKRLPVYSGVHPCRAMSFYAAGVPWVWPSITPYYDYNRGRRVNLSEVSECYVVVDEMTTEKVDKGAGPIPDEIKSPLPHWEVLTSERVGPPALVFYPLKIIDWALTSGLFPNRILGRPVPSLRETIAGGRVTIYYVPKRVE